MDNSQLLTIITEILIELDSKGIVPFSQEALRLMHFTAVVESNGGEYLKQCGNGPALGIYQMEPTTELDIWDNYLLYRDNLSAKIGKLGYHHPFLNPTTIQMNRLVYDLVYQTLMARLHYYRVKEKLPKSHNIQAVAEYYKKYYNTIKGKATVESSLKKYKTLNV